MLTVCTWLWGDKYPGWYVDRLIASLDRNIHQDFRSVLITNQPVNGGADWVLPIDQADRDLLYLPGCLARIRMFDRQWQIKSGIPEWVNTAARIVCIDLDAVITGQLDQLFDRDDEFTILQHVNSTNPCPFNGSLWMFRSGIRHDVWGDFSVAAVRKVPYHAFPDDQGWLHHKFPNAAAWTGEDGVYAFKKRGWPDGDALPANARVVAFPGWRDPSKFTHLDWVKENWR